METLNHLWSPAPTDLILADNVYGYDFSPSKLRRATFWKWMTYVPAIREDCPQSHPFVSYHARKMYPIVNIPARGDLTGTGRSPVPVQHRS